MNVLALLCLLPVIAPHRTFASQKHNLSTEKLNNRPIIAILAQRYPKTSNRSFISASYVKHMECAGARVVPIPHHFSEEKVAEVFKYVNGVLFPGGGITWFTSDYYKHGNHFWDLAMAANDNGDYFPIWGTCYGFQALHAFRTGKYMNSRRPSVDLSLVLNFTKDAKDSRMFKDAPADLYSALATEKLAWNHHKYGITPKTYEQYPKLKNFFKVLSTNLDVNGNEFISTVEGFKYPVYGSQWHAEKNSFEFTTKYKQLPHSANAIKVAQYMANFFVNEARKNLHKFPSEEMEKKYLIYNYTPTHTGGAEKLGTYEQVYFFNE